NENSWYEGIVVCRNQIFVIDGIKRKVRIHGLHDGKLQYESDILESSPFALHLINDTCIAVILMNGLIKLMSTHNTPVRRWTSDLRVLGGLDKYHGVVSINGDFVVCGVKNKTECWCIVSSNDGRVVGNIYQICKVNKYSSSSITAKHNIIYISCDANSPDSGVYAYDVQNPGQAKYCYKHKDLMTPTGIVINQHGSLFVCNTYCIHHLTSDCQLVSIITQGISRDILAIYWDDGLLYITCIRTNHITRYRTQYP
ncbi:hypothetical protein ACJMK2_006944, partial [Sinanodonta woodiana]